MHIQEAMACGALPMVTGVGAADEFVNEICGIKLNARQAMIDANDPRYFIGKPGDSYSNMGSHFWVPEVDVDDIVGKLKHIYYHHDRQPIFDKVKEAKLFTWEDVATAFTTELEKVAAKTTTTRKGND